MVEYNANLTDLGQEEIIQSNKWLKIPGEITQNKLTLKSIYNTIG